ISDPANTIIFADINGDGWLDMIIAYNNQTGGQGFYYAYYNDGTGVLETSPGWRSGDGGFGSAVSVYDHDNDGDDDLAAGRWWDQPRIYENLGDSFTSAPVWRADEATVVEEIAWIDVDGDGLEARSDTFFVTGDRKLFYTSHHPLQSIDSVRADDVTLGDADYCFDLVSGWVSLGTEPSESIIVYYQYSFKNDLTISNWDTYNMAYGNSAKPLVEFYADVTFGQAPLTVHFSDSSAGASDWLWRFGDGGDAAVREPVYTFNSGGAFDVYLENTLPDGKHNRTIKKMMIVLADTVYFPEIVSSPGDTVKVPLYLKNSHPLHYLLLPILYDGPVQLQFLDFDTDSCRTDYFDRVNDVAYYPAGHQIVFSFLPTYINYNPPLEPGYGRLINLYFLHQSGSGTTILDTTTLSTKSLYYDASYVNYQPTIRNGYVASSQVMRGDANGDLVISLLDATFLIDYLYKNGPVPDPYAGDADSSRNINILDVAYLINYLYKNGPPPLD
ncbi:MAG: VCBS repeat-containing protein, partial [Candidatus Zixiibacteriota bacterium]